MCALLSWSAISGVSLRRRSDYGASFLASDNLRTLLRKSLLYRSDCWRNKTRQVLLSLLSPLSFFSSCSLVAMSRLTLQRAGGIHRLLAALLAALIDVQGKFSTLKVLHRPPTATGLVLSDATRKDVWCVCVVFLVVPIFLVILFCLFHTSLSLLCSAVHFRRVGQNFSQLCGRRVSAPFFLLRDREIQVVGIYRVGGGYIQGGSTELFSLQATPRP